MDPIESFLWPTTPPGKRSSASPHSSGLRGFPIGVRRLPAVIAIRSSDGGAVSVEALDRVLVKDDYSGGKWQSLRVAESSCHTRRVSGDMATGQGV